MKYDHDKILDRWQDGHSSAHIAESLKAASSAAVRTIVQRARDKGDARATPRDKRQSSPPTYTASSEIGRKLNQEAVMRGISVRELIDRMIRVAVSDDMFGSILDDGQA